ncbi:MAG: universal stress protein [Myxococcota bacterium]
MVAVDPHDPADEVLHALPWAARLTGKLHLRGVTTARGEAASAVDERVLEELQEQIPPEMTAPPQLLHGVPGHALVDEAARFDLLVMGTHGRRGLGRAFMGSVAERVVRMVDISVVVAPRGSAPIPPAGPLRLLLPVDAREPSVTAVTRARRWFGADAELHVVNALDDMSASQRVGLVGEITTPEEHPHYTWSRERILEALNEADLTVDAFHFVLTTLHQPAPELADFRAELGVDLLAMPTHGRRGGPRVQFGSVTERLVRLSDGPSLVVR